MTAAEERRTGTHSKRWREKSGGVEARSAVADSVIPEMTGARGQLEIRGTGVLPLHL